MGSNAGNRRQDGELKMTHNAELPALESFLFDRGIANSPREDSRAIRERERNDSLGSRAALREQWVRYIQTVPDDVAAATVADAATVRNVRHALGMNESEFGSTCGLSAEQIRRIEAGSTLAGRDGDSPFDMNVKRFVAAAHQASRE